jgi:hypothetical protein
VEKTKEDSGKDQRRQWKRPRKIVEKTKEGSGKDQRM